MHFQGIFRAAAPDTTLLGVISPLNYFLVPFLSNLLKLFVYAAGTHCFWKIQFLLLCMSTVTFYLKFGYWFERGVKSLHSSHNDLLEMEAAVSLKAHQTI